MSAVALAAAVCLLGTGAAPEGDHGRGAAGPAERATLQRDVDAVHTTGTVGVLARADAPDGFTTARAGVAERGTGRPVPHDARFRIGSTTKAFTATVLLQLVDEGRLGLDDTVERWLPGVVAGNGNDGRHITVRHLLQHTSGLFDYFSDTRAWPQLRSARAFRALRSRTYSASELVGIGLSHPPDFAPGTGWGYSNTNYVLAGMLIERVTGRDWRTEVTHRIIRPLGLRDTTVPHTHARVPGPHAHGYRAYADDPPLTDVTVLDPSGADAAGAMISTTADIHRFFTALLGGGLLAPPRMTDMLRSVPTDGDPQEVWPGSRYGLGLMWFPNSCGGYWGHPGDVFGFSTRTGVTPDARRGFTVSLTGTVTTRTDAAVDALADRALCRLPSSG